MVMRYQSAHDVERSSPSGAAVGRVSRCLPSAAGHLLSLQAAAGNRALGQLFSGRGGPSVPVVQRMKLSNFSGVSQQMVQLMTYGTQRRGCPYYLMIDAGSGWHVSIPVRNNLVTWSNIQAQDFNSYHVTDPGGNHYQYESPQHVRKGTDGAGPFDIKTADQVVSRIFGVHPTVPVDPNAKIREFRSGVMGKSQFTYLNVFNGAVGRLAKKFGTEPLAFDALEARSVDAESWYDLMDTYEKKPDWATFEAAFKPADLQPRKTKRKAPETPADETRAMKLPNTASELAVLPPPEPISEPVPEKESTKVDTGEKEEETEI
jgi:hypothetical protein